MYFVFSLSLGYSGWRSPITNYSIIETNAGRQNWAVSQGANGWIYFANNSGILEYNGYNWTLHNVDGIKIVRSLNCAQDGKIYVGGEGGFGYFAPDEFGRMIYHDLTICIPKMAEDFREIWDIHVTSERVYFRSRRSIIIYNGGEMCEVVPTNGLVLASCVVNNNIYFATTKGLYVLGDGSPILLGGVESLNIEGRISAMSPYADGEIMIATSFDGLYTYNNGDCKPFKTKYDDLLSKNQTFSLATNNNKIACGTVRGGVILIDSKSQKCNKIDLAGGMGNNTILSLGFDDDDNLWCGLDNGIDKISLSSPLLHFDVNREYKFTGYCALTDDRYTYLGTNQGLVRVVAQHPDQSRGVEATLVENSDGQVWGIQNIDDKIYCSHNRGLFLLHDHPTTPSLQPIYTDDGVWGLTRVDDNHYLVGTYEGLRLFNTIDQSVEHIDNYRESARDIFFQDDSKCAFFVTSKGLERVSFSDGFQRASSNIIIESERYDIKLIRIDGKLLVYSLEGVYLVTAEGDLELTSDYKDLFEVGVSYSTISIDERENIWYIVDDKLLLREYDPIEHRYNNIRQIFDNPHFFVDGFTTITPLDARYYVINSIYGYSVVDSHWRESERRSVKPRIISIFDTNNRDSLLLSCGYGVEPRRIELPYIHNSLRITFANNSISDGTSEYSYRLKGSDSEWSKWSAIGEIINQKEYTQLREGEYTFVLRVRDKLGRVESCDLDIKILPPWQRSTMMYIVYSLFACGLILVIRSRISLYYADRRRLVELQKEREIESQKRQFLSKAMEQENSIIRLKNEKLEGEVVAKSAELSGLLLNKLEKNDIITGVKSSLGKINIELRNEQPQNAQRRIKTLDKWLNDKLIDNVDWSTFEDNFNLINNNFVQKITQRYVWMNTNERKLCVYIKMGLQNKEIAPLLNLSVRGVEMLRYRVRKKMELDRNESLYEFLQRI
ncbi:MAG: triple tyrosine motif-containing protein [Rikenellaceae bacterium]